MGCGLLSDLLPIARWKNAQAAKGEEVKARLEGRRRKGGKQRREGEMEKEMASGLMEEEKLYGLRPQSLTTEATCSNFRSEVSLRPRQGAGFLCRGTRQCHVKGSTPRMSSPKT